MTRTLLAALMVIASCLAHAGADDWQKKDSVLLGGALGTLAIDWAQTRKLTSQREVRVTQYGNTTVTDVPHYEHNPLLGKTPTNAEINRYFLLSMGVTAGLAFVLPPTYRRIYLGALIVVETAIIIRNDQVGLQFAFQ